MGRMVLVLTLLASVLAGNQTVRAAQLPESLRTGLAGVLAARHQNLLFDVYGTASADAAAVYPEHAEKLSEFAGFVGRQAAEQGSARQRVTSGVQALLAIASDVDGLARAVQEARGALTKLEREQLSTSSSSEATKSRHRSWIKRRASLVRELDALERQHERVRLAASRYGDLAASVKAGEHDLQRRSASVLNRFNGALERHNAALSTERAAQVGAVSEFKRWYSEQRVALERMQQRIDASHREWNEARAATAASLNEAKRLAGAYDRSPGPTQQTEALAAQDTYQAALAAQQDTRVRLLSLQAQGKALLEQTLGERKAREDVLAQARQGMTLRHATLVASIEADRAATEAEVAANDRQLQAQIDAAAEAVKRAEDAIVQRYGSDYQSLHRVLVTRLASPDDAAVLDTLPAQTTQQGRALVANARAAAADWHELGLEGEAPESREVATSTTELQSLRTRYEALGRQFRTGVNALRDEQTSFRLMVTSQRQARQRRLQALLDAAPGLGNWGRSLRAAIALLETEFRHLMSTLSPDSAAPGFARERWQRTRVELRRVAGKYPRLRRQFEGDAALLLGTGGRADGSVATLARSIGSSVLNEAALAPLATSEGQARRFAEGLAAGALLAWSRLEVPGVWRFLEGRFRYSNQSGFERDE